MFHSQYCLVTTVVHIQPLNSQIRVYIKNSLHNIGTLVGQKKCKKNKLGQQECRVPLALL
jgi:hypothetical protein